MLPTPIFVINPDEFFRCIEQKVISDHPKSLGPIQKTDTNIKANIYQAFRKDNAIRAPDQNTKKLKSMSKMGLFTCMAIL